MTPAAAVSCSGPSGVAQRADGGDQAGGDDLGVGDRAVDEDDEVAVLAAGQPVLAAQAAGQPGGERAQDGGLGRPGCRRVGGEAVDADEGQGVRGGRGPTRCTAPSRRTSAARLGSPVTGSVSESSSSSGSTPGTGARGGDVAAEQDERADVGVVAQVADGGLDQPPAAVGVPDAGGADGDLGAPPAARR